MKWILIIQEDPDLAQIIAEALSALDFDQVRVTNFADAREKMLDFGRCNCQLVVSSLSASSSPDLPRPLEGNRAAAAAFVDDIRGADAAPPFVFLVRYNDSTIEDVFKDARKLTMLSVGAVVRDLPALARQIAHPGTAGGGRHAHEVDVDIYLTRKGCRWDLRGTYAHPLEDSRPISLSAGEIDTLLDDCRCRSTADLDAIRRIGRRMYEILMRDNGKSGLGEALSRHVRNTSVARFRFHLDRDTNQLLVETMGTPANDRSSNELQLWMLRAPVMRKYGESGARQPLYKDRKSRTRPVECLIILGDSQWFQAAPPVAHNFDPISAAAAEAEWLYDYLHRNRDEFGIRTVQLMRAEDYRDQDYGRVVRETLAQHPWQLVHYVGHSTLCQVNDKGYLVLGGGQAGLLDIDDFAGAANHLQFLFLSSCTGGNAEFVSRLAEENIPAVAGYAWPIEDDTAYNFAKDFYHDLFEGSISKRFLEYSFMRAKVGMYERYKDKSAWAAPLLFMQLNHAQPDQV